MQMNCKVLLIFVGRNLGHMFANEFSGCKSREDGFYYWNKHILYM